MTTPPAVPSSPITSRQNVLRAKFSLAMSQLYQAEVPLYKNLVGIVQIQNKMTTSDLDDGGGRLEIERHGAIRLGTPEELHTIGRIFRVMGMSPVGYYDISSTGIPLHATAFRPTMPEALAVNPFRVFTTLLRVDMLSEEAQKLVSSVLSKRKLFSPELYKLLDHFEKKKESSEIDEDNFIKEVLKIFVFRPLATVTHDEYIMLKDEHPVLADIAAFSTAHINHLTPRALDISAVQKEMVRQGIGAKSHIEGPPERQCPILLRQTSFMAVEEQISFIDESFMNGSTHYVQKGVHRARFGEVEQRGAATTRKGREYYDSLLEQTRAEAATTKSSEAYDSILQRVFKEYPDDWETLRKQGLVFFQYQVTSGPAPPAIATCQDLSRNLDDLIAKGIITYKPIVYEDFLPISAAGIFQSNLNGQAGRKPSTSRGYDKEGFVRALGMEVLDEIELYETIQEQSLQECLKIFGGNV